MNQLKALFEEAAFLGKRNDGRRISHSLLSFTL